MKLILVVLAVLGAAALACHHDSDCCPGSHILHGICVNGDCHCVYLGVGKREGVKVCVSDEQCAPYDCNSPQGGKAFCLNHRCACH